MTFELRLDGLVTTGEKASSKVQGRTREKSAFVKMVEGLGLKAGQFAYISHKVWMDMGGSTQSEASQRNGCVYTLRKPSAVYPKGLSTKKITLSGQDLEEVMESNGVELNEQDIIYSITVKE